MKHSKDAVLKVQKDRIVIWLTETNTDFLSTIYVQSCRLSDFISLYDCRAGDKHTEQIILIGPKLGQTADLEPSL